MKGCISVLLLCSLAFAHKSRDAKTKWWSIPEPVATVGKLFYFKIPHDSFIENTGPIDVSISFCHINVDPENKFWSTIFAII